jgi:hypothetical protein
MTILVMLCLITARSSDGGRDIRGNGSSSSGGGGGDGVNRGGGTVRREKCMVAQRWGSVRVRGGRALLSGHEGNVDH